ncbi:MAG: hypothetical protein L0215_16655, partial [Gemmataceae bacterium]|nr:hypothetical protein [Gemmataceae bacterium]
MTLQLGWCLTLCIAGWVAPVIAQERRDRSQAGAPERGREPAEPKKLGPLEAHLDDGHRLFAQG